MKKFPNGLKSSLFWVFIFAISLFLIFLLLNDIFSFVSEIPYFLSDPVHWAIIVLIVLLFYLFGKSRDLSLNRNYVERCCAFAAHNSSERSNIADQIFPLNKVLPSEYAICGYEIDDFVSVYLDYRSWLLSLYLRDDTRLSRTYKTLLSSRRSKKEDISKFTDIYQADSYYKCFYAQTLFDFFTHHIKDYDNSHRHSPEKLLVAHKMYYASILMLSLLGHYFVTLSDEEAVISNLSIPDNPSHP